MAGIREISGVPVLAKRVEAASPKELRAMGDKIRDRLASGVVLLGASDDKKAFLLALVTPEFQDRFPAGKVVKTAAKVVGGGGGGRPDMAQAGGPDPERLDEALKTVYELVEEEGA